MGPENEELDGVWWHNIFYEILWTGIMLVIISKC